jgi:hypothetical protein
MLTDKPQWHRNLQRRPAKPALAWRELFYRGGVASTSQILAVTHCRPCGPGRKNHDMGRRAALERIADRVGRVGRPWLWSLRKETDR